MAVPDHDAGLLVAHAIWLSSENIQTATNFTCCADDMIEVYLLGYG